jgi:insulysin
MTTIRTLLAAASMAAALASTAAPVAAPPVVDLPPRIVAPTDKSEYRRFVLGNGLRVLLVSDPRFNKSGAALVVNVGQMDDPAGTEGMAHFLEHMLFLGTEKYPDVSDYGNYIRANGGYNNAYTSTDHTNYQFEVRHAALPGALDRFSQFFIAPRFNPEFVGREVNAVHNEAMRHVQNDLRRRIGVARELYAPGSGESKFSTGNKETLAGANPEAVRRFYEAHYSADRMALAIAGTASLDELERLARQYFAPIVRRELPPVSRQATFLPRERALRLALVEPVKEVRSLALEFVLPATRPDFAAKPGELVEALVGFPGEGGLLWLLKREGLANSLAANTWERTGQYGSFFITVDLTPEGRERHGRVIELVHAYLEHLRSSPYPAAFFAERARIAALEEAYKDRGEGAALATQLANQALFYPLAIAERVPFAWVKPDEAAYRRVLDALRPDNMLAFLQAKGVPTDRKERIYGTAYSYRADPAAYAALARPARVAAFRLPGANAYMPAQAQVLSERPLALVDQPGLQLYYALDTEFQRPATAVVLRFVPVREMATLRDAAALELYEQLLRDYLEPRLAFAQMAGTDVTITASIEGLRLAVSGFGDSPARVAADIAASLRSFQVPAGRFEALKEARLRVIRSYAETEAFRLARDRRDVLQREFHFLPGQMLEATQALTWADVQAFAARYFARGKIEAVVHGHTSAADAAALARRVASLMGAQPVPEEALLRRRHVQIAAAENVLDAGEIAGVNTAFTTDYLLPDDSPATRAAAVVAANFFGEPFYTELRTRQQLGYIVGSGAGASVRERYFSFTVQSSAYAPDELRRRAEAVIATLPAELGKVSDEKWATLVAGARATLEKRPKSIAEKADEFFEAAYLFGSDWERRQAALAALDGLTREKAAALLASVLAPESARRRSVLLYTKAHPMKDVVQPTIGDRGAWLTTRRFQ